MISVFEKLDVYLLSLLSWSINCYYYQYYHSYHYVILIYIYIWFFFWNLRPNNFIKRPNAPKISSANPLGRIPAYSTVQVKRFHPNGAMRGQEAALSQPAHRPRQIPKGLGYQKKPRFGGLHSLKLT